VPQWQLFRQNSAEFEARVLTLVNHRWNTVPAFSLGVVPASKRREPGLEAGYLVIPGHAKQTGAKPIPDPLLCPTPTLASELTTQLGIRDKLLNWYHLKMGRLDPSCTLNSRLEYFQHQSAPSSLPRSAPKFSQPTPACFTSTRNKQGESEG
jgi:hypothetical protein